MKIPSDLNLRNAFYRRVIEACMASSDERRQAYAAMRNLYLFGSTDGSPAIFNKINPHIELLGAYLYAPESVRWGIAFDPGVENMLPLEGPLAKFCSKEWYRTGLIMLVDDAIKWALIYNTMIVKLAWWNGALRPYLIEPGQFGVYREDVASLDAQEAVVHSTYLTRSNLSLRLSDDPRAEDILARVRVMNTEGDASDEESTPLRNLIITSATAGPTGPTAVTGQITTPGQTHTYKPQRPDDLVHLYELWIYDDELADYRIVTYADPDVLIYDRPNVFVKGELPFGKITPRPLYDYFWGESEVQLLQPLQELREKRLRQLDRLFQLQADPPRAGIGIPGITDEKLGALRRPGGALSLGQTMGQAKIETFAPSLPQAPFAELQEIDSMFSELSGITPIMQGRGEQGVRSNAQAAALATMASARPKKRAIIVEDSLSAIATLMLHAYRKEADITLRDETGAPFKVGQIPKDFTVHVEGHTSSPVFAENATQMAMILRENGVLDDQTFIEMLHPPMMDIILAKLPALEKAKAAAAAQNPPPKPHKR